MNSWSGCLLAVGGISHDPRVHFKDAPPYGVANILDATRHQLTDEPLRTHCLSRDIGLRNFLGSEVGNGF